MKQYRPDIEVIVAEDGRDAQASYQNLKNCFMKRTISLPHTRFVRKQYSALQGDPGYRGELMISQSSEATCFWKRRNCWRAAFCQPSSIKTHIRKDIGPFKSCLMP